MFYLTSYTLYIAERKIFKVAMNLKFFVCYVCYSLFLYRARPGVVNFRSHCQGKCLPQMNEMEFINSDIQPNAYYMHEQLKENNYSFSSFLLLAAVCVKQFIAFFFDIFFLWTKGMEGTYGSLYILE